MKKALIANRKKFFYVNWQIGIQYWGANQETMIQVSFFSSYCRRHLCDCTKLVNHHLSRMTTIKLIYFYDCSNETFFWMRENCVYVLHRKYVENALIGCFDVYSVNEQCTMQIYFWRPSFFLSFVDVVAASGFNLFFQHMWM